MHKARFAALCLASAAVALAMLRLFWNIAKNESPFMSRELVAMNIPSKPPSLYPYHHVLEQLEWSTEFGSNAVCCTVAFCLFYFQLSPSLHSVILVPMKTPLLVS